MNHRPRSDTVRERMQQLRHEIDGGMEDVSASARTMIDWKHYVKKYPWVCLGAAATLGFLIVPKRSRTTCADVGTLTELTRTGQVVVKPAPTITAGVIHAILATAGNIAIQRGTAYLGQSAGKFLGK